MAALAPLAPVITAVCFGVCTNIPPAPAPPALPPEPPVVAPSLASTLPIEVLGPSGTIESLALAVTNGSSADNLWLQIHNLNFEGKASVRINGGDWYTLTDTSVVYPTKELGFFGMGGILDTLRFHIPLTNWTVVDGTNTVDFRFNDNAASETIGYRVLGLAFRTGTNSLTSTNQFVWDDPAAWVPITTNAAAIADGLDAWRNLVIQERGTNINARCTDCHAWDGRDLKYFNYSDRSIIARSIFHAVPPERATNIAAYIRSLNIPYEPKGRPWNPPYQPGPGLDAQPVRSWAAGAGLEAALEHDTNTLSYIFPSGITTNAINLLGIVNAREIPLVIQFPTWNRWLPRVHPLDQWPAWYATNRFTTIYPEIRAELATRTGTNAAAYFRGRATVWDRAGTPAPEAKPSRSSPRYPIWEFNLRHQRHWRQVKVWEIMQEWALEEYGADTNIFPLPANGAALNARRWFHGETFRLGPHVIGGIDGNETWAQESMQWYQVQLALHDGNRRNPGLVPIDWGYLTDLNFSSWSNPAGLATYGIAVLNMVKALEVGHNGIPLGEPGAWNPFLGNLHGLENQYKRPQREAIPAELRAAVAAAVITPWLDKFDLYTTNQLAEAGWLETGLSNRLTSHLTWFPGLGVDPNVVARISALRTRLFPSP